MVSRNKSDFLIVGSGFSGLTTALYLFKNNKNFTILEAMTMPSSIGGTITMFPNAMKILRELDLADDVISFGARIKKAYFKDNYGNFIVERSMGAQELYGEPTITIRRSVLIGIFLKKLKEHNIEILYNKKVTHLVKNNSDYEVLCEDKSKFFTDFIVGADGLNSKIREYILDEPAILNYSGQLYFAGFVNDRNFINSLNLDLNAQYVTVGPRSFFAYSVVDNISRDDYSLLWYCYLEQKERYTRCELDSLNDSELVGRTIEIHRNWHSPILSMIEKSTDFCRASISDLVEIKNWFKDNVVVIGDAAHAMNPISGQGAATGMEDAQLLIEILCNKKIESIKTLEEFQKIRKKRVIKIGYKARNSAKLTMIKFPAPIVQLRNFLFAQLMKITPERFLNWTFRYNYKDFIN
jgi:2-polyprenyl-6-methoxyphenol hydroxylase-like FAD-dependent oxidoreductase